jgi:hypothetical protein
VLFRPSGRKAAGTWRGEQHARTVSDARLHCNALQIALQSTFHGPLAYSLHDYEFPIFTRLRMPTPEEVEAGLGIRHERSFYRNSFSMVRSSTTLQRCGANTWAISDAS